MMSYFCIDTIVNNLLNSSIKLETLSLRASKLDKMAAFHLLQAVISNSQLKKLDLSSNI